MSQIKNKRHLRFLIGIIFRLILPRALLTKKIYSLLSFTRRITVKALSTKFFLQCCNEEISNSIFYSGIFGDYEGKTLELWYKIINYIKPAEVYDVGANIGIFSLLASIASPSTHIQAFEPNPNTLQFLKHNIRLNNFNKITVNNFALSTQSSKEKFYNLGDHTSPGLTSIKHQYIDESLPVSYFDSQDICVFRQRSTIPINVIKLDIERAELKLLNHAKTIIESDRPIIFLEILDKEEYVNFEDLFHDISYSFIKINDSKKEIIFSEHIKNEDQIGRNWICYPNELSNKILSSIEQ